VEPGILFFVPGHKRELQYRQYISRKIELIASVQPRAQNLELQLQAVVGYNQDQTAKLLRKQPKERQQSRYAQAVRNRQPEGTDAVIER